MVEVNWNIKSAGIRGVKMAGSFEWDSPRTQEFAIRG
jgi:hypothetical protein